MKQLVGQVTAEERNEIQMLFERRNGIAELSRVLTAQDSELYEKLIRDMGETNTKFQDWWQTTAEKYQWEGSENGRWEIDFETCEIYLISD